MDANGATDIGDSGLACLVIVSRLHGIAADAARLAHEYAPPGERCSSLDLIRAARSLGFRCREVRCDARGVAHMPLPAIAPLADGSFAILAGYADGRALLQDPGRTGTSTIDARQLEATLSGRLILLTPRDAGMAGGRPFGFSWFLPAVLRYRTLFGEIVFASFVIQLLALVTPLFFQVVVDKVLVQRGLTTLDVLAAGLVMVSLFDAALNGLRNYVFAHTSNRIDVTLGAELFRHLLCLPLGWFGARRVGDVAARVRELESIRGFITGTSLTLVIDLSFGFVFVAAMLMYSPVLTAVALACLPLYAALAAVATPVLRARLRERFRRGSENQAFLIETLLGIETLKSCAVEPQAQRRWEGLLAGYVTASFRAANLGNVAGQCAALIGRLGTASILWLGARAVIAGTLSIGELIAFNMLAAQVSRPVLRIVQIWQDFQQAGMSVQRLGDILNAVAEPAAAAGCVAPPEIRGHIAFEGVHFRYRPDGPEVLRGITLAIPAGATVGIVGRSGSGKSTLARLVQRLHVPERGRVRLDGVDLAMIDPAWLRRRAGVVLQDSFLFNRSIRDNIALTDPAAPFERVVHAARLAGAHDFILDLPGGYDAPVDEHGGNLSCGQRQRIAIARALLGDPRILIFDEATSALDYESEHVIHRHMRRLSRGRTVLIIAHRLSAVRHADLIVVLERGCIVESGTHAELLGRRGWYARVHAHQLRGAG